MTHPEVDGTGHRPSRKGSGRAEGVRHEPIQLSGVESLVILLACTAAILLFTYMWGAANLRPVRPAGRQGPRGGPVLAQPERPSGRARHHRGGTGSAYGVTLST